MATTTIKTYHCFRARIEIVPINPKYKTRPYISGSIFSIKTEYKKELVSHDGIERKITCDFCGEVENHKIHDMIIRADRAN